MWPTTICCSATALTVLLSSASIGHSAGATAAPASFRLFPIKPAWSLALNSTLTAPPAFAGRRGYFPLEGERLAAYDLVDGTLVWIAFTRVASQPALGEGLIFVLDGNAISARHEHDGSEAWRLPIADPLITPLVWDNGWLVATTESGTVLAVRGSDGDVLWRHDTGSKARALPVLAADRVYLSLEDGRVVALEIGTGEPVWARRLGGPPNDILALDDRLFVGSNDNFFYCLRAGDGIVDWRWRTGADVVGTPVVDEHNVYFVSLDNVLRALDRKTGGQRWKRPLPIRPTRGPIRAGTDLLLSGIAATISAYAMKDGAPAGDIMAGGELATAPFVFTAGALPAAITVIRDIVKGTVVAAVSRSIDPPTAPVAPLPDAIVLPKSLPTALPPTP
jgi:outer membrane protein assembly factor BamB